MVVDDNEDAGMMLCLLLEEMGFVGVSATTGREAIQKAETFRPFLVLLDLRLPDMSGIDVCRTLRETLGATAKVVALTGWALDAIRPDLKAAGFDDWFLKPMEVGTLRNLLGHVPESVEGSSVGHEVMV